MNVSVTHPQGQGQIIRKASERSDLAVQPES